MLTELYPKNVHVTGHLNIQPLTVISWHEMNDVQTDTVLPLEMNDHLIPQPVNILQLSLVYF